MNLVWTDLGASAYTKQARTPMYLVRGAAILHAGESSPRCGRSAPRGGGRGSAPTQRGLRCPPPGLDHGIGHVMLFEVDSEVRAPAPPMPILLRISSAASDRKSAPLPSSRQAG